MTKRNNPFSSKWDNTIDLEKASVDELSMYQVAVNYETLYMDRCDELSVPYEELELSLYMAAIDDWRKKDINDTFLFDYVNRFVEDCVENDASIPDYIYPILWPIYREIFERVNGESEKNIWLPD